MKRSLMLLTTLTVMSSCGQSPKPSNDMSPMEATSSENVMLKRVDSSNLLTLEDAEKILGEPAHRSESSCIAGDIAEYKSAYTANATDSKTGKTGTIYFMMEEYPKMAAAHDAYIGIKKSNEHNGIETLHDLGDEAYFHTDGTAFYFILVRKGNRMFRMKVNKLTTNTVLDSFNAVARNITEAL